MGIRFFIFGLAASLFLTACGQTPPNSKDSGLAGQIQEFLRGQLKSNEILITDRFGTPLSGAQVLIGTSVGQPFAANFLTADSRGVISIPAAWTSEQPVTIEAPGMIRTTYMAIRPQSQVFELNEANGRQALEVTGKTTAWTDVKKDGFVDYSLVTPMVSRSQLFGFNVSDILSPEVDQIQAYGQDIFLPSNFSIPKQSENYGIFPVSLDKLIYRSYVHRLDQYRFVATRGKFQFRTVIKKLEDGKSYWDILNDMDFVSAGAANVGVTQMSNALDLSVAGFTIAPRIKLTAAGVPQGASFLATVWNEDQGVLFPSDIKTFVNNETRTLEASNSGTLQVATLVGKHRVLKSAMITLEEQSSRAITPFVGSDLTPQHLDLIRAPAFDGQTLRASPPAAHKGLTSTGTYVVISDVVVKETPTMYHETKHKLWEVFAPGWSAEVALPAWPAPVGQSPQKRIEVAYLATTSPKASPTQTGPAMVDSSTHATKNALDF